MLIVLFLALISTPVAADVTVVAVPYVGGGVVNFTAVYITDTQVDLSWTKGDDIVNVMVRAKYGSMPMSRTEGYLVYEGALETVTDTSMNFDETAGILYYRAWAQNSGGVWDDAEVTTDETEGMIMAIIALFLFGGVLSYLALRSNFPALKMAAGFAWFAVFIYVKGTPLGTMTEGSSAHSALLLVLILVGAAMLLTAIGGTVNHQRNDEQGNSSFGDWKWRVGRDRAAYGTQPSSGRETPEQYQLRVRAALRRNKK